MLIVQWRISVILKICDIKAAPVAEKSPSNSHTLWSKFIPNRFSFIFCRKRAAAFLIPAICYRIVSVCLDLLVQTDPHADLQTPRSYISHSFHFFFIVPGSVNLDKQTPQSSQNSWTQELLYYSLICALWFSTWDKICVSRGLDHIPQGHLNIWNECVRASAPWLDREVLAIKNLTPSVGDDGNFGDFPSSGDFICFPGPYKYVSSNKWWPSGNVFAGIFYETIEKFHTYYL